MTQEGSGNKPRHHGAIGDQHESIVGGSCKDNDASCEAASTSSEESLGNQPSSYSKKARTHFSPKQLLYLEEKFLENNFPDAKERDSMCKELNLTRQHIQIWFQNRRAKVKRKVRKKGHTVTLQPPSFWPSNLPFDTNLSKVPIGDVGETKSSEKSSDSSPSISSSKKTPTVTSSSSKPPIVVTTVKCDIPTITTITTSTTVTTAATISTSDRTVQHVTYPQQELNVPPRMLDISPGTIPIYAESPVPLLNDENPMDLISNILYESLEEPRQPIHYHDHSTPSFYHYNNPSSYLSPYHYTNATTYGHNPAMIIPPQPMSSDSYHVLPSHQDVPPQLHHQMQQPLPPYDYSSHHPAYYRDVPLLYNQAVPCTTVTTTTETRHTYYHQ